MNTVLRTLLLGAALLAAPQLLALSAAWAAAAAIAVGVLAAWSIEERMSALVVSAGAVAALAWVSLLATDASLAGGVFIAVASAPRALRVSPAKLRAAGAALALIGGGLGAFVAARYASDASIAVRAACLVASGILASLVALVPADEALASELEAVAQAMTGDVSATLARAAALRRRVAGSEVLEQLSAETRARVEAGWGSLAHTASRRAALGPELAAGAAIIDARIASHVDVLERVHAAAAERVARTLGLENQGIHGASLEREGLEAEVRALAEITDGAGA